MAGAADLIERLFVMAAAVMEDALPEVLISSGQESRGDRIDSLIAVGRDVMTLGEAARFIADCGAVIGDTDVSEL